MAIEEHTRKAIFISAIDYESPIQIGDHQLARQFALHGWQVAFISKPITFFHFFSKQKAATSRRFSNFISGGLNHKFGNGQIWSYVPFSLIIPQNNFLLRNNLVYRFWQLTHVPSLLKILRRKGFSDVDLIYFRDPIQGYLLKSIKTKKSIFRIADNDSGFSSYNNHYADLEATVARSVDCVLYSAKELENYVNKLRPKCTYYLPNGVDHQHFVKSVRSLPDVYKTLNHPIVVYAGSIDFWFDFDLVSRLAFDLPSFSFVIIGPNNKYRHKFNLSSNIYLLGPVSYDQLPAYLSAADIGIIPFNVREYPSLVNSISPVKMYEYFACGLPVIASKWNEIKNIRSPAILCESYEEFLVSLSHISLSEKKKQAFKKFSAENDWAFRYQEIEKIIRS